jgi:branched-chain amino acid transport system substrate-binding protein
MSTSVVVRTLLLLTILALPFTACKKKEPLQIGFIGGLTGKVADLGIAGRNGALLAIEQQNASGGIHGSQLELVVRDDEQNPDTARKVAADLITRNIELIIGPMTSSVAMAIMPQINASKSILLSPTVTTTELSDKDDNFLRAVAATTGYAIKSAHYQYEKLGSRTVAVTYDSGNKSYTESWLNEFEKAFTALGGKVILKKSFQSSKDISFQAITDELLASKADTFLIITNAVDSALLCQQLRSRDHKRHIAMSEWAATERFIELAGTAADGVVVSQFFDRTDTSQRYRDFLAAYRSRFNQEPGFAGVAGYDSALIAIQALGARRPGEPLKNTIINTGRFQGVQQLLDINRYGDANRNTFISVIQNGQYRTAE